MNRSVLARSLIAIALGASACSLDTLQSQQPGDQHLIDGQLAPGATSHPALIVVDESGGVTVCTSSVVAPQVVLAAGHCFDPYILASQRARIFASDQAFDAAIARLASVASASTGTRFDSHQVYVYFGADAGAFMRGEADPTMTSVQLAWDVVVHPGYRPKPGPRTALDFHADLAIVLLAAPVADDIAAVPLDRRPAVPSAQLATLADGEVINLDELAAVEHIGFGAHDQVVDGNGDFQLVSDFRRRAGTGLLVAASKRPASVWHVGPGEELADTCPGDSGGPLLSIGPGGTRRVLGVHSFGIEDCRAVSASTHVPVFAPWIDAHIADGGDRPLRPVLECVGPTFARFGYDNQNAVPLHLSKGEQNSFYQRADLAVPEVFLPGRQQNVFEVPRTPGTPLVWRLAGRTATAGDDGPACPGT